MFNLFSKKTLVKINMLNPEHPDGYFTISFKVKDSIIEKYAKDSELYAMASEIPRGEIFTYKGSTYRFWDDFELWNKTKDKFTSIDDNAKGSSLGEIIKKQQES